MQFCKKTCSGLDEANGRQSGFCIWSGKQIDMIQLTFLIYLGLLLSGMKIDQLCFWKLLHQCFL
jgi:hypothetical protein